MIELVAKLRQRGEFFEAMGAPVYAREVRAAADALQSMIDASSAILALDLENDGVGEDWPELRSAAVKLRSAVSG